MKKWISLILLTAALPIMAQSKMVHNGCHYQGDVANGKPHGKGVLTCPDGRIYTGEFAQGEFHGTGQFVSPNAPNVFLSPFGMRSGKLKGFVLNGKFRHGSAVGTFKVYQNGKHLLNMVFDKGMLKNVTATK
ncbi:hypothetical protein MIS46_03195 [Wielerella bovis]|uniref:hypothetical protein n=1 Tax=Wielerella bovis TaxID=2917790 RepID=UPI0020189A93|nr:hypothetical protein [Wielerella bovis]ULJ63074.1 hypothetical protein MIS46_03195 [Wielerella bovis]